MSITDIDTRTAAAVELAEQARLVAERAARMTARADRLAERAEAAAAARDAGIVGDGRTAMQAMIAADLAERAADDAAYWVERAEDCKRRAAEAITTTATAAYEKRSSAAAEAGTR